MAILSSISAVRIATRPFKFLISKAGDVPSTGDEILAPSIVKSARSWMLANPGPAPLSYHRSRTNAVPPPDTSTLILLPLDAPEKMFVLPPVALPAKDDGPPVTLTDTASGE